MSKSYTKQGKRKEQEALVPGRTDRDEPPLLNLADSLSPPPGFGLIPDGTEAMEAIQIFNQT